MRNKEQLNQDFDSIIHDSYKEEIDIVQMSAHDMRHTEALTTTIPAQFTKDLQPVTFMFKEITREGTEDEVEGLVGDSEVVDYEYLGFKVGGV